MLKLLCVGDIHIKVRSGVPTKWQVERYQALFQMLIAHCRMHKASLVIAGDTLNTTDPSPRELHLLLDFLHDLNEAGVQVFLASGNHETMARGESILDYLALDRFPNLTYRPAWNVNVQGVTLHLLNHDSLESTKRPPIEDGRFNVLISHFRCNVDKFIREETDVAALTAPYDLTVAGDIHDSLNFDDVWYTNCPVNSKFTPKPSCGYLMVEIDPKAKTYNATRVKVELPNLRSVECAVAELDSLDLSDTDFYKVTVNGTPEELRTVTAHPSNVRLAKVPSTTDVLGESAVGDLLEEVSTISGTVEEEVAHYLNEIKYGEDSAANVVSVMREYTV